MIFPWTKIYSVRMAAMMMKRLCLRLVTDSSFFFLLSARSSWVHLSYDKCEIWWKKRWGRCLLRRNISIKIKFTSRMKLASNQIQFAHVEFQPVVISITYKIAQRIKISICMKIACLYVVMNDNHLRRSQEEELVASFCRSRRHRRLCVHFYVVWLV